MSQVVLQLNKQTIQKMKSHYAKQSKAKIPPGAAFAAKTDDCSITAYQSGKVLFQGKNPHQEAERWGKPAHPKGESNQKQSASSQHSKQPPAWLFTSSHAGSDEAGTGDFFGPITVAAVYLKHDQLAYLKEAGVKDSKHLSDQQIKQLVKKIVHMKIPYTLLKLNNKKYNELQASGWTQGKMKTMLHHRALDGLLEKIAPDRPDGILIDQFSQPEVYQKHLKSEGKTLQEDVYFMTKAESYSLAVASASILARSSFVKAMDDIAEATGLPIPKGASSSVDQAAAQVIETYGEAKLDEIAKTHFSTTSKARKLL
ncbi:ribonuclease HIII [Thalassobacillus sp. CUG 92003]|uniref:ribonuclease HIII n=1 Tax=Thalassobacillus sp. CUG 92003 TaxID=2736641 RepID=UPI0015E768DA|nr:ribonuclease HIII [Thalassobacillus sp. CUG 92003]